MCVLSVRAPDGLPVLYNWVFFHFSELCFRSLVCLMPSEPVAFKCNLYWQIYSLLSVLSRSCVDVYNTVILIIWGIITNLFYRLNNRQWKLTVESHIVSWYPPFIQFQTKIIYWYLGKTLTPQVTYHLISSLSWIFCQTLVMSPNMHRKRALCYTLTLPKVIVIPLLLCSLPLVLSLCT